MRRTISRSSASSNVTKASTKRPQRIFRKRPTSAELIITIDQLSSYINTQIEEGRIGVLLSMKNGNKLPDGIVFVYNNNFYPAYGNMHVAMPLINYGEHTISITNLLGTLGQHDDGSSRLISQFDVELCVLPDDRYYSKIDFVTDVNKDEIKLSLKSMLENGSIMFDENQRIFVSSARGYIKCKIRI